MHICRLYYTDSQLYTDIMLHYIYRMCVKINVLYVQCTVYTVHIAYNICIFIYLEIAYLHSQDYRILRAFVK